MTAEDGSGELYTGQLIGMLELVWGEGWLSPGGPDEVAAVDRGHRLCRQDRARYRLRRGRRRFPALRDPWRRLCHRHRCRGTVLITARRRRAEARASARACGFVKVWPGPLPFPPESFDIVFSKDAIVHIPDKHALMRDVFRMLKPGGWFVGVRLADRP